MYCTYVSLINHWEFLVGKYATWTWKDFCAIHFQKAINYLRDAGTIGHSTHYTLLQWMYLLPAVSTQCDDAPAPLRWCRAQGQGLSYVQVLTTCIATAREPHNIIPTLVAAL